VDVQHDEHFDGLFQRDPKTSGPLIRTGSNVMWAPQIAFRTLIDTVATLNPDVSGRGTNL
jgi:hypothetical protein